MNKFFDGEFMTFGLDVIRHMEADQEDRMDPMIYIFPRMTKCTFYKYGVSGEVSIVARLANHIFDNVPNEFIPFFKILYCFPGRETRCHLYTAIKCGQ